MTDDRRSLADLIIEHGPFTEPLRFDGFGDRDELTDYRELDALRDELIAARAIITAYRESRAKGYFRYPRGPVANAVDDYDRTLGR